MRKGFTLIEVAVIIAIVMVLIALLLPAINQARKGEISPQQYAKISDLCSKNELVKQRAKFFMQDKKISNKEYWELINLDGKNTLLNSLQD